MNSVRVLVVDDDPWILRMVSSSLEKKNFVIDTARDGKQALQKVAANPPALIITDVMMPVMDGWTFVQQVRAIPELSRIPVLFLTALGKDEERLTSLGLRNDDYISKPFRFDELERRVYKALSGRDAAEAPSAAASPPPGSQGPGGPPATYPGYGNPPGGGYPQQGPYPGYPAQGPQGPYPGYPAQGGGYPAQPGQYPGAPQGYPGQPYPGYPGQYPGHPGQPSPYPGQPTYPGQQGGYPAQAPPGAYPGQYPPGQAPGYPGAGYPAYPGQANPYPSQAPAGAPAGYPGAYPGYAPAGPGGGAYPGATPGPEGPGGAPGSLPPGYPGSPQGPGQGRTSSTSLPAANPSADDGDPGASKAGGRRPTGLSGRLEQLGLSSLLVMMEMERKDGILALSHEADGRVGRIFLRKGQVIQARLDKDPSLDGPNSVYEMLRWQRGKFSFAAMEIDMEDNVHMSTTGLLMEGARIMDEENR